MLTNITATAWPPAGLPSMATEQPTKCPPSTSMGTVQRAEMRPMMSQRHARFARRVTGLRGWPSLSVVLSWGGPAAALGGSKHDPDSTGFDRCVRMPTDRFSTAWPNSYLGTVDQNDQLRSATSPRSARAVDGRTEDGRCLQRRAACQRFRRSIATANARTAGSSSPCGVAHSVHCPHSGLMVALAECSTSPTRA